MSFKSWSYKIHKQDGTPRRSWASPFFTLFKGEEPIFQVGILGKRVFFKLSRWDLRKSYLDGSKDTGEKLFGVGWCFRLGRLYFARPTASPNKMVFLVSSDPIFFTIDPKEEL